MARKLYVGGLSFNTTEDQLREAFAKFGAVESATVIRDRYSDRSRGFGLVETISDSEAEEAIPGLNGALLGKSHAFCPKCGAKVEQAVVQQLQHGIEAFSSVPTAIFAFPSHPQDFASTVIYAVSLGGDTHTIASMAGGYFRCVPGDRGSSLCDKVFLPR